MAVEKNEKNAVPIPESLPQKKADQKKFWHIDKEMLRFKIHYFLFCGTFGTCLPYLTIFAQKRVGISASALAAILTTQRCICILTKPAIGYIADYFNKLKIIICIISVVSTAFVLMLLSVPKIEKGIGKTTADGNSTFYKLLNNSEAFVVNEIRRNNSSQSAEVVYNNRRNDVPCFQSLQNLSDFLSQSSENKKNGQENAGNRTEYSIVLKQKLNAMSPLSNVFLCKIGCELTNKCQIIDCEKAKANISEISVEKKPISDFQTYQFWLYAFLTTISTAFGNSLFTLTDTACCESIQKTGAQFGRQSLWGSVGWGLMSPISGLLNDYTGDFLASWILMAIMSFISLLNMAKLKMTKPQFSKNLLKDVKTVLSSKEFLAFKFCVLMNGVGAGIMWFYLVLFLTDIGGSRFLFGMVMFTQCFFGEIPFMFFSGWVIKKIGHFNVLTLTLAAYLIRFFWYSQLHNPWLVLPVEVLNGFTEGLLYTNVASFAKLSSKPGTEATTQAVLFTAHEGLGVGIGCVVAGLGFDSIGGHRTFLYTSIYAGCAMVLSIILHLLIRTQKRSIAVTTSTNA
ncbi:Major facilitator superfamily domain-containing protein 6 [Araneus ventricosus]|uniref:Major facilitator superfamily domain-containing protein 6 n=1 Tax=Araneus ventricosus TaxID=182803 RepID=A0A4Y2ID69_ARAVE|nr:Major facilitator superfamily domain-containing protein 6 [Araneus ventricosus]